MRIARSVCSTGASRYENSPERPLVTEAHFLSQNAFHQNLMQMRETARASIISPNQNGISSARSTIYSRDGALSDESQAPIMQNAAPKASSGLRNYLTEDNSSDYEDGMMMQTTDRKNRF